MAEDTRPLAPLLTMTEADAQWCHDLQRAQHAAFSLVVDYLRKATTELDAQRAARAANGMSLSLAQDAFAVGELLADQQRERERLHAILLDISRALPNGNQIPMDQFAAEIAELRQQVAALTAERNEANLARDIFARAAEKALTERDAEGQRNEALQDKVATLTARIEAFERQPSDDYMLACWQAQTHQAEADLAALREAARNVLDVFARTGGHLPEVQSLAALVRPTPEGETR